MDLNALSLFVAVSEAGSLSEAARRTGVPLPTVSRRVRALEEDLGVRLLERGKRGLTLTDAGARLVEAAKPGLEVLSQAPDRARDAAGLSGTLRISLPPHFDPMRTVQAAFASEFPEVRFDVFVTDRRVDLVADGVDVAIRIGEGGSARYVGRTLARYRHRLVAAPSLLADGPPARPADLATRPAGCWRTGAPPAWRLGDVDVPLTPVVVTNDYEHLRQLAVDGQLVTELPPFLAEAPIAAGRLVEVLPDFPLPVQSVRALVADTRLLPPLVRRFLDFTASALPPLLAPTRGGAVSTER